MRTRPCARYDASLPFDRASMRPLLRWLHLSDLHHGLGDGGSDKHDRLDTFFDDVRRLVDRVGAVDLVLFTGDLTQAGSREQFDSLDAAVIEPLRALLGKVPVLAVPGNHDLQWDTSFAGGATTRALCDDAKARGMLFRGHTELLAFVGARFAEYTAWWSRTRPDTVREGLLPGDFLYTFERAGLQVGVAGLNTAGLHLHGGVGEGQLHVDAAQLRKACKPGTEIGAWLKPHDFNLLMTHHPPSWLEPTNRAEAFVGGLLAPQFDLHLFGHMHVPVTAAQVLGGGPTRHWTQAASLFGLEKFHVLENGVATEKKDRRFGYGLVELCEQDGKLATRAFPRRAEKGQDEQWRYGSDRSYVLDDDYLAAKAEAFTARGAPPAPAPTAPVARDRHVDAARWAEAVRAHPLWGAGASVWRDRVVAVVRLCAEEWASSVAKIGDDPWRDADFPVRVIDRLAEIAGPLRPAQVAVLLAAPFVYEAVRARALGWIADAGIDDFGQRIDALAPRPALEEVHRANAREVRLAERERLAPERKRAIALWMAHRAVDRVPEVWDPKTIPAMKALHARLAKPLGDDAELACDLARCLEPGLARLEGEGARWAKDRRLEGEDAEASRLGTLLVAAGALALDGRRLDPLVVDHVGTDKEFDARVMPERLAATRWSAPTRDRADVRVARVECPNPVTHFLVVDLVKQARTVLAALKREWSDVLPGGVSESEVRPEGDAFRPVHVRFRLDHVRVRELLMGVQLYKDPTLAIRELYQNALDACRYRKVRNAYLRATNPYHTEEYLGSIVFRQGRRPDGRMVIECQDDGVGMDELTLERVFAVAGQRFHDQPAYLEEKARWEAKRRTVAPELAEQLQLWPNSQHGIGVLSYFMLADELEVLTRAYRADGNPGEPIRVEISSASGLFRVTRGPEDLEVGTRVRLVLEKETHARQRGWQWREEALSAATILGELLIVAEGNVWAVEGCIAHEWRTGWRFDAGVERARWTPGVPRVQPNRGWELAAADPPYVWWTNEESTPLLVDGLVTGQTRPMVLVNLTGPRHAALLSADRSQVLNAADNWLEGVLGARLSAVAFWHELSISWMISVSRRYPSAFRVGWPALVSSGTDVRLETHPVYVKADGCLQFDQRRAAIAQVGFLPVDRVVHEIPPRTALGAWRRLKWGFEGPRKGSIDWEEPPGPLEALLLSPRTSHGSDSSSHGAGEVPDGSALLCEDLPAIENAFGEVNVRAAAARIEARLGLPLLGSAVSQSFAAASRAPVLGVPNNEDDLPFLRGARSGGALVGRFVGLGHAVAVAARLGLSVLSVARRLRELAVETNRTLTFDTEAAHVLDEPSSEVARGLALLRQHPEDPLFAAIAPAGGPTGLAARLSAIVSVYTAVGHVPTHLAVATSWSWTRHDIDLVRRWRKQSLPRTPSASRLLPEVRGLTLERALVVAQATGRDFGPKCDSNSFAVVGTVASSLQRACEGLVDARLVGTRWLLLACDHTSRFGIDPARAVACAGRWWCWWLTEEERTELGAPLIPIVQAEAEWWERVRDTEDDW